MPNALRIDPTRTIMLRRAFVADMNRRFQKLIKSIKQIVVIDDVFGLKENSPLKLNLEKQAWKFNTDAQKVEAFQAWLKQAEDASILTTPKAGDRWTDEYIYSAYRKGHMRAYADLHKEALAEKPDYYFGTRDQFLESAFNAPEIKSKLQLLYTRTFTELKGITAAIDQQLSRQLAEGLANGWGVEKIAREIDKSISTINRTRARVLARTEIIRAHSEGQLDAFEKLGVEEVGLMAEWSTAGDDRVCDLCGPKEGETMTVEEARGQIPFHPNCRCTWIPSVKRVKRTRKQGVFF